MYGHIKGTRVSIQEFKGKEDEEEDAGVEASEAVGESPAAEEEPAVKGGWVDCPAYRVCGVIISNCRACLRSQLVVRRCVIDKYSINSVC